MSADPADAARQLMPQRGHGTKECHLMVRHVCALTLLSELIRQGAPVPEGHPTIAQRFNVGGTRIGVALVPSEDGLSKGILGLAQEAPHSIRRALFVGVNLSRPCGTWPHLTSDPSVETLGYSH